MRNQFHKFFALAVLYMLPTSIFAQWQSDWAIVKKAAGDEIPVFTYFSTTLYKAGNGKEYARVGRNILQQDKTYLWVWLPYGIRIADKRIYVYDFDNEQETVAFDFTLSTGDKFTTINGMEWVVKDVTDTLVVDRNFYPNSYKRMHKLLSVETTDGKRSDQWLEDFGSFTCHLMIYELEDDTYYQTPWVYFGETEENEDYWNYYIAREFSCDPLFGHDTGWMDGHYNGQDTSGGYTTISYADGNLTFRDHRNWYSARYYHIYYRENDDIYCAKKWELFPHVDGGESFMATDEMVLTGLPAPASGSYTLHHNGKDITTQICQPKQEKSAAGSIHDLQGRRLTEAPARGMYILNGKVMMK